MARELPLEIDRKMGYVLDDFFTTAEIHKLRIMALTPALSRSGYSSKNSKESAHYSATLDLGLICQSSPYLKLLARGEQLFGVKLKCDRVVYRERVFGDHADYHFDTLQMSVTALIYLNEDWKDEYHGETLLMEPTGVGVAVMPRPGRLLMFDGRVTHTSASPSRTTYIARQVLVFNFHPFSE